MFAMREVNLLVAAILWTLSSPGILGFVSPYHPSRRRTTTPFSFRLEAVVVHENDGQDTLESLSAKLTKQLHVLETDENIPTDTAKLSLLYTRLLDVDLHGTRIGPSSIPGGGRGLFAERDFVRGDLLTCYPGDALVIIPDDNDEAGYADWTVLWGHHVEKQYQQDDIDSLLGYIVHAVEDEYGVVGLPALDQDVSYAGHFANDGATCIPTCVEDLVPYVLESLDRVNANHKDLLGSHMITVATRDIKKGDEIFVTYGPDYWREQPGFQEDDDDDDDDDYESPPTKPRSSSSRGFG